MKNIEIAEGNRLSDSHLITILRIKSSAIKADIDNIIKGKQCETRIAFILVCVCIIFSLSVFFVIIFAIKI